MFTNTVTPDTTRTKQKSQYRDDPYFHNLLLHHELTQLLDINLFDNKWFSRVSKVLNIRKKELTNHVSLNDNWKKSWGELSIGRGTNNIYWENRYDMGPDINDPSSIDARIKIIKFILMAHLTEVLTKLNMSSFQEVGVTANWQKAKVKLNMKELQNVLWADVLTGKCSIKGEDKVQVLKGHIDIIIEDKNLSFF